jgi:uncharacterized protein DUF1801
MQSKARTVAAYIAGLPEDRRPAVKALRTLLNRRVPKGYRESMQWGAITWSIPLERFPDTYNGQPLCYAALASQKNHLALYLMCAYGDKTQRQKLVDGFRKAGKKLDMGKSCIRFQSLDDLPLQVIGDAMASVTPEKYIAVYRKSRGPGAKAGKARAPRKKARA